MGSTKRALEDLNIIDDFLINAIATDEKVGKAFCRDMLSVLLQRKIGEIRVVAQRTIPAMSPALRGIRMDVEVEEKPGEENRDLPAMNIYDLEPHIPDDVNLVKHNRFYQAKIDSRYLKSGETDFSKMPDLYVISILNYDPFGYGYMMYNVHNRCEEVPGLQYDDGLKYIYFYTDGTLGGSKEIKAMLNYIKNSSQVNVVNEATKRIHEYVNWVRLSPEVKIEYMKFDDIIAYERREAAREAAKEAAKEATIQTTRNVNIQNICELLEEYGRIPKEVENRIKAETDEKVLKGWHKLAAKVESITEFMEKM